METQDQVQRAFLVARVSSRHQAESGLGIASQISSMRRYMDSQGLVEAGVKVTRNLAKVALERPGIGHDTGLAC